MSRLVLPLESHCNASPSRVVRPSSLENFAGVSAPESLASRSRKADAATDPLHQERLAPPQGSWSRFFAMLACRGFAGWR
jgi:hypothetical protein